MTVGLLDQEPEGRAGDPSGAFLRGATGVGEADAELAERTDAMAEDLDSIQRYTDALDRFDRLGGHDFEARAATVAAELGFASSSTPASTSCRADSEPGSRSPRSNSPGSTRSCSTNPRTTSTPKPSNGSRRFVRGFAGGVVVVSHDRAFLDSMREPVRRTRPVHAASVGVRWGRGASTSSSANGGVSRRGKRTMQRSPNAPGSNAARRRSVRTRRPPPGRTCKRSDEPDKYVRFAKASGAQDHAAGAAKLERKLETHRGARRPARSVDTEDGSGTGIARQRRGGSPLASGGPARDRSSWDRSTWRSLEVNGSRSSVPTARGSRPCCTRSRAISRRRRADQHARSQRRPGHRRSGPRPVRARRGPARDDRRTTGAKGAEARSLLAKFELGADDVRGPRPSSRPANVPGPPSRCSPPPHQPAPARRADEPPRPGGDRAVGGRAGRTYPGTFVIATHDRRLLETIGITRTIGVRGDERLARDRAWSDTPAERPRHAQPFQVARHRSR